MKRPTKILTALLCLSALSLANAGDYISTAKVIDVVPRVEEVNRPSEECQSVYREAPSQRSATGAIIGGIAGGILGHQVGRGSGRALATGAGAITGAIVGDRLGNQSAGSDGQYQSRECRLVDNWERRTTGYAVTYEYAGRTFTTVMPYKPGRSIRVNVSVTPVE